MVLQYLIKVYCIKVSVLMGSPTNLIYIISPTVVLLLISLSPQLFLAF